MSGVHLLFAVPLLVIGWVGIHMKKSALGGAVAILIMGQGILALAALVVFQRSRPAEGAVLLWVLVIMAFLSLLSILALGLRRYYSDRDVSWRRNEELRH